ncbi:erythromycin esterase family protein [Microlunatus soli]|uniref:Erythromycin esterase n=1 Tax=Microlunatus soli TaxID=630515 RepID=A0A1H1MRG9_9ACTN|nr:erythromycin esterase family protein [Microlunatus soli]SDR89220.1 Erythromycin esterase [Microlunatus soli]
MPTPSTTPSTARLRTPVKVLLITVLATVIVIGGAIGWTSWTRRPQGEPQATEFAGAEIAPRLSNATVLALGEATHGNHEFQQLRLQLVGKLPSFGAIVLEEDYGSVARANAYLQGGPGTAQDATRSFGFVLNHTEEMAHLLEGIRRINDRRTPDRRIRLVGMDVQRIDANKQLALDGMRTIDPALATEIGRKLHGWNDVTTDPGDPRRVDEALDVLADRLSTSDDVARDARNAATALQQNRQLDRAGDYAATRARIMAENLRRTVSEEAARGNDHTLLFAHDGHLDKTSAAYAHPDLGALAARRWGDRYRVIGTDLHESRLRTGDRERRWEVRLTNRSPLRGMFAGTRIGYLDVAAATPANRRLLDRRVRMASAGESFHQWQAWVPWLNSVSMIPSRSYDALIMVDRATPVTPLR